MKRYIRFLLYMICENQTSFPGLLRQTLYALTDLLQPPVRGHLGPAIRPAGRAQVSGYDAEGFRELVLGQGPLPRFHVPIMS